MKYAIRLALAGTLGVAALGAAVGMAEARGGLRGGVMSGDFATLDANGNGFVTLDEMVAESQARFALADLDGNGVLSKDELIARAKVMFAERAPQRGAPPEGRLNMMTDRLIARADKDGDGALSAAEIQPSEDRLAGLLRRLDTDNDNALSAEEFAAAEQMMRGHKPGGRTGGGQSNGNP